MDKKKTITLFILLFQIASLVFSCKASAVNEANKNSATDNSFDVVVYGGTPAGLAAAIQVARLGKSVALIEPTAHVGGIMVNGLGGTDIDNHPEFQNSMAVGGLAMEFYRRLAQYYGRLAEFDSKLKSKTKDASLWRFEPHVADEIIKAWLKEYPISLFLNTRLKEGKDAVQKDGTNIRQIETENGQLFSAKVFIDATLEGDLLFFAGVSTTWGRESNSEYGETKNGVRAETTHAQFLVKVDPYIIPGNPSSGVIPTIQNEPFGTPGESDKSIQAYCFRMCLTRNANYRIAFVKPENYDRSQYEIYLRYLKSGGKLYTPVSGIPNGKTDLGAWHDLSHNLYGLNRNYPNGSYADRQRVFDQHKTFTQGLFYFLANDTEVATLDPVLQNTWKQWGLCKDEFTDNGGWPRLFYVRDARRMVSDYVITEQHTSSSNPTTVEDPVAVAYWPPDLHSARRIVKDGYAYNEGFVFGGNTWRPFGISYRALVPKRNECTNLFAPGCPSSSHVAYGAIRIEFTYMAMGQACAVAAALAIDQSIQIQDIDYKSLKEKLISLGQIINATQVVSLNRPVTASSTDHAPTAGEFAVDGEDDTGWRAIPGELPQWICVDLQAECSITGIELFCEANNKTPLTGIISNAVRGKTLGSEIFSSYATSYKVEVSLNNLTWKEIYTNKNSSGGKALIELEVSQQARFVRIFIDKSSNSLPVGMNEIRVLGSCISDRPTTFGWTERRKLKKTVNPELKLSSNRILPIEDGWELNRQGWNNAFNGSEISKSGLDTKQWYNATVPGTIVATLVDQEVFPDPVIGLNNLKIPESLCRHNWWYRRSFILPEKFDLSSRRTVFLELDGINQHANIWFNGQLAGNIPSAFLRGSFDVTEFINKSGENVIAIEVCPMSTPGVPGDKGEDGNVWVQSGKVALDGATYVCSSGWDWMPAMRDRGIGILGGVRLKSSGPVVIDYPGISTDLPLPDTTKADLSIEVPVKNVSGEIKKAVVTVQFEKIKVSKEVELQSGESKTVLFKPAEFSQLHLKKPKLWWPNGYGNQNLYRINIFTQVDNELSDSFETNIGIREITYNTDSMSKERRGQSNFKLTNARYVRLNCQESINGYFSLFDFCVYNADDLSTDLAAFKPISANSETVGGKAKNANDRFAVSKWSSGNGNNQFIVIDLGKEYSINRVIAGWEYNGLATKYSVETSTDSINWQIVDECAQNPTTQLVLSVNGLRIFCRGGNWGLFDIALRMPEEKMKQSLLFHKELGFTMIRNWMGNTMTPDFFKYCDQYGLLVMNDFWAAKPIDEKAYVEVARENIRRFRNHPSLAIWCGSNESYPPPIIDEGFKKAIRELDPDRLYVSHSADDQVAGFGPYFYTDPKNYFPMARGFKTEIGLATMPVYETIRKMTGDNPVWPINKSWYYHDYPANSTMMSDYLNAMETRLGKVTGAEDYCKKAQFVNYENLRAIFEAWNHKLWDDCSALLLWMSHPAWYSTVWQLYDYDFEVGGAWAGTKKGSEVYHVQATLTDWKVDALNYSSKPLKNVSISSKIYNVDGIQIGKTQTAKVDIPASDKTKVFDIAFPLEADSLCFVKLEMKNAAGQLLSDNFYWKYQMLENLRKLNAIPNATIEGKMDITKENDQTVVTLRLKNVGKSVGVMLVLSLVDEETSERILPTHYSDNYFWMLPEEEKVIKMKYASVKGDIKKPIVRVSGYNLKEITINHLLNY